MLWWSECGDCQGFDVLSIEFFQKLYQGFKAFMKKEGRN